MNFTTQFNSTIKLSIRHKFRWVYLKYGIQYYNAQFKYLRKTLKRDVKHTCNKYIDNLENSYPYDYSIYFQICEIFLFLFIFFSYKIYLTIKSNNSQVAWDTFDCMLLCIKFYYCLLSKANEKDTMIILLSYAIM